MTVLFRTIHIPRGRSCCCRWASETSQIDMAFLPEVKTHYGKLKLLIDGEWVDSTSTQP